MIKSKLQLVKKTLGYSKVSHYSVQGDLGNWIRVTEDYIKQNFAGKTVVDRLVINNHVIVTYAG